MNPNHAAMWFVKHIWPDAPFKDAWMLIFRQTTLLDRVMMFEAVTSRTWGRPDYLIILSLKQPALLPFVRARLHRRWLLQAPTSPEDVPLQSIPFLIEHMNKEHIPTWVGECVEHGNMQPLDYVCAYGSRMTNTLCVDLINVACQVDSLYMLQRVLKFKPHNVSCYRMRPKTWKAAADTQILFKYCQYTDVLECIAASPHEHDEILQLAECTLDRCIKFATKEGVHLDTLAKVTSPRKLLEQSYSLLPYATLSWMLENGIAMAEIPYNSWSSDAIIKMWPRLDPVQRAHILASSGRYLVDKYIVAREITHPFDKMTFLALADYSTIKRMGL
jgi:hypothetical protein